MINLNLKSLFSSSVSATTNSSDQALELIEAQIFKLSEDKKFSLTIKNLHENLLLISDPVLQGKVRIEIYTESGYNPLQGNILDISFDDTESVSNIQLIGHENHVPKVGHGSSGTIIINGVDYSKAHSDKELVKVIIYLPVDVFGDFDRMSIKNCIGSLSCENSLFINNDLIYDNSGSGTISTGDIKARGKITINLSGSGNAETGNLDSQVISITQESSGKLNAGSLHALHEIFHTQNGSGGFLCKGIDTQKFSQKRTSSGKFTIETGLLRCDSTIMVVGGSGHVSIGDCICPLFKIKTSSSCQFEIGDINSVDFNVHSEGSGSFSLGNIKSQNVTIERTSSSKFTAENLIGDMLILKTSGSRDFEVRSINMKIIDLLNKSSCKHVVREAVVTDEFKSKNSGSGNIEIGSLKANYTAVSIESNGKFTCGYLKSSTMDVELLGSANFEANGEVGRLIAEKTSSGALRGGKLSVSKAELTLSGSADVTLNMHEHDCLIHSKTGSGKVYFV